VQVEEACRLRYRPSLVLLLLVLLLLLLHRYVYWRHACALEGRAALALQLCAAACSDVDLLEHAAERPAMQKWAACKGNFIEYALV
jgi:hypothetical protein